MISLHNFKENENENENERSNFKSRYRFHITETSMVRNFEYIWIDKQRQKSTRKNFYESIGATDGRTDRQTQHAPT